MNWQDPDGGDNDLPVVDLGSSSLHSHKFVRLPGYGKCSIQDAQTFEVLDSSGRWKGSGPHREGSISVNGSSLLVNVQCNCSLSCIAVIWGRSRILWSGVRICECRRRYKVGGLGHAPLENIKSWTSETPFSGLSGWIWGKKRGFDWTHRTPLDPPQVMYSTCLCCHLLWLNLGQWQYAKWLRMIGIVFHQVISNFATVIITNTNLLHIWLALYQNILLHSCLTIDRYLSHAKDHIIDTAIAVPHVRHLVLYFPCSNSRSVAVLSLVLLGRDIL